MSSVEFVRNPDPNTAVYRWEATGVDELTRHNKLTSLPFWIPNAATRHHQFKLVLLRGLVPSVDAANDAFGLVVEIIPPPPPATKKELRAAASTSSPFPSSDFPGGCAVTCEVLPLDALENGEIRLASRETQRQPHAVRDKALCSTKTAVIDATNMQVSFPDLIPADILANSSYVSGTSKSLMLQITIETGINVPLHQVATTAYSFFSSFSSSVSQLLGTTTHLVHEGRENLSAMLNQTVAAGTSSPPPSSAAATGRSVAGEGGVEGGPTSSFTPANGGDTVPAVPPPWEQPPEEWRNRPEAWRALLCDRLAKLIGTYRHGIEKTLSSDEVALLSEVGLSESDLWSLYPLFSFDRDVQENLLTATVVRAQRYALVPAKLREETFWANYFWKVHCVGQCVTERQVSAVIAVLCTPSSMADTDLPASLEDVRRLLLDATEVNAVVADFVERKEAGEPWCTVVVETARHCAVVLQAAAAQRSVGSSHTTQQLEKALSELKATLSRYGAALSTPPTTPAMGIDATKATLTTTPFPVVDSTLAEAPPTVAAAEAAKHENTPPSTPPASPPPTAPPVADSVATRSEKTHSSTRIEFPIMPWEEEDS